MPRVKSLTLHCTDGQRGETISPTWRQVAMAIRALDGELFDQVALLVEPERNMGVGGGENGIYVCEVELPANHYLLTDPTRSDIETISIMNGQMSDYVASHTVNLKAVLRAAKHFFDAGDIDRTLTWLSP